MFTIMVVQIPKLLLVEAVVEIATLLEFRVLLVEVVELDGLVVLEVVDLETHYKEILVDTEQITHTLPLLPEVVVEEE